MLQHKHAEEMPVGLSLAQFDSQVRQNARPVAQQTQFLVNAVWVSPANHPV